MSELSLLKSKLNRLRCRRSVAAWLAAFAAVFAVVGAGLIVAFLLDVMMHLGHIERLVVLLMWIALVVWAIYRFVIPLFRNRESLVELALQVEQQLGIHSELVAAMQFEDRSRRQYGLADLRHAVISDTSDLATDLDYRQVSSNRSVMKPLLMAATVVVAIVAIVLQAGDHAQAFARRFLLGEATFPTRTQVCVVSPGKHVAYGQPVTFRVEVTGERPERGLVRLTGSASGEVAIIDLAPDSEDTALYSGRLQRALEDCIFIVEVGDAMLGPLELTVIPLPQVTVDLQIEPPAYAADRLTDRSAAVTQNTALTGSRVTPFVTADKKLRSVTIKINDTLFSMHQEENGFALPSLPSQLARIEETLRYEVMVEDTDGLSPQLPVSGTLRVREDRPPQITSHTATKQVLPTAMPVVHYIARDDFGIHRIQLQLTVIETGASANQIEHPPRTVLVPDDHPLQVAGQLTLSLSELELAMGDRVVCVVQTADHRGTDDAVVTHSEPLVFEVTDRSTLLKSLIDADEKIDEDLESIIQVESGLGGKR